MATAKFIGSGEYDDKERYERDDFGNAPEPGGDIPMPESVQSFDEWWASEESAAAHAAMDKVPSFMKQQMMNQLREQYTQQETVKRAEAIEDVVPGVVDASRIDPNGEVTYYQPGTPLDLSSAKDELWDPLNGRTSSAYEDLEFVGPQGEGRDAQVSALGYLDDVAADGTDAVSDAQYEFYRSDAEQAARAQREAGVQNLQERGMYGGGAGIMNELMVASDISRDTHNAALESAAIAQARRDAANRDRSSAGATLYGQDTAVAQNENAFNTTQAGGVDSFDQWFSDQQAEYGRNRSDLEQNESVTNWNRGNTTHDKNVGMRNDVLFHNKDLPFRGLDAFSDADAASRGEKHGEVDYLRGEREQDEAANDPWNIVGRVADTGGKVVGLSGAVNDDDEDED